MTGTLDTLWSLLGWGIGALAVVALVLALFGDAVRRRFRKLRRCPKCWYDLSHTPSRTCSECGYTAKREKQLFKTRRPRHWILFILLLSTAASTAVRIPAIQKRGWRAAIPTTILIAGLPLLNESGLRIAALEREIARLQNPATTYQSPHTLANELIMRMDSDELADWQWFLATRAALRLESPDSGRVVVNAARPDLSAQIFTEAEQINHLTDPTLLEAVFKRDGFDIRTRPRWPLNEPIMAEVTYSTVFWSLETDVVKLALEDSSTRKAEYTDEYRKPLGHGHRYRAPWEDRLTSIGSRSAPCRTIEYVLRGRRSLGKSRAAMLGKATVEWNSRIGLPIAVDGSIDDLLTPVESPEFIAAATSTLAPRLQDDCVDLGDLTPLLPILDGATFAVTIEVMWHDAVLASGQAWWDPTDTDFALPFGRNSRVTMRPMRNPVVTQMTPVDAQLKLRITSNPHMALRNFGRDRYWSGDFIVSLTRDAATSN